MWVVDFWDISLLLALVAAVLLIVSEVISPNYGRVNILISRKRLKQAGVLFSFLFLVAVCIRIVTLIASS